MIMPTTNQKPPSPYRNLVQIHIQSWMFTYIHTYRHNNMKRKQIVTSYKYIYENKHIHTYIHTQMILVSLLCIQASMLSYPILLRWVKTPIEKKVSLVSMSIQSTYSTCIHQHTYQVSHVLTFHLPIIGIHLFIHTCLHTYITITDNTLLFW